MIRKRINCLSCESKLDVIIRESNFDEEDVEVNYCPVCSTEIEDESNYEDWQEYSE